MMIIIPLIIGILLILWLQHPQIKKDEEKPLYKYIFDIIKVPIIFTCIVSIIYLVSCNNNSKNNINQLSFNKKILKGITNQKVYIGLPRF